MVSEIKGLKLDSALHKFAAFLLTITMGFAWNIPNTELSAALGWLSCLGICYYANSLAKSYRWFFISGTVAYLLGFHWLFMTIRQFGGFSNLPAAFVFTFFLCASALQYVIFIFLVKHLPPVAEKFLLTVPVAWCVSEFISIRVFPWYVGHTQLAFTFFAQVADIGGAILISFLMFWVSAALINIFSIRKFTFANVCPLILFCASIVYGYQRFNQFNEIAGPRQEIGIIQANVSIEEKNDISLIATNTARYLELSQKIAKKGLLIIWPETVITEWIFAGLQNAADEPRKLLPHIPDVSFLIGSLSYSSSKIMHNSAFAIMPDGSISSPYHKMILMPFGEFMPFSETFPWLKDLNPAMGNFTAGPGVKVFEYKSSEESPGIKISPLICYEDVVPSISREAVLAGAQLLVNLTNDAWFGNTIAPFQHHLIASFRAIENRRYLLRSTNSGLSAVVDPLGRTVGSIPVFSEGTLIQSVKPLDFISFYSSVPVDKIWWAISILSGLISIFPILKKRA